MFCLNQFENNFLKGDLNAFSSSINISQCGIYYSSDWFVGWENWFYNIEVFRSVGEDRKKKSSSSLPPNKQKYSYAIKPVLPAQSSTRPIHNPTLENIDTAAVLFRHLLVQILDIFFLESVRRLKTSKFRCLCLIPKFEI